MFFLSIRHRLPRPASALVHQWNRALSSSSSSTTTKTAKDGSTQRAKDSNQQKKQGTNDPPSISEKEASRLKKISKLKDELRRGYFYELGQVNRTKSKLFEADKELRSIEKAVKVPSFEADSLLGVTHQFESLLQIKRQVSLVGIAFRDFGFQQLPSWIKPFQEEFAGSSSFKIFQVAFEDKTWLKMLKFLMVNGQKSSIERERHGQSFIRFGCTEDIREALDMDNRMVGYALLVDGKGRVRWRFFIHVMMKKQIVGAISMYEAGRIGGRLQELRLRSSQELRCVNLMCEKVGNPCICRLAKVLSRTLNLELLDLANNNLSDLPSEIWNLKKLRVLDLSGNQLKSLPFDDGIQKLPNLETLNFEGNPIKADLMKIQEFLKGRIRKKDT